MNFSNYPKSSLKTFVLRFIINSVYFLKFSLKKVSISLILLIFLSTTASAEKIVIIDGGLEKVSRTISQTISNEFKPSYNRNYSNIIVISSSTDLSTPTPPQSISTTEYTPHPSNETYSTNNISNIIFSEKINDSSLLSQRSTEECKSLVTEVLNKIPSSQYSGLNKIELLYDKSAKRGGANSSFVSIRCNDVSDSELKAVFIHELGHVIDGSYLTGVSASKSSFSDFGTIVKADDPSVDFYSLSWKNETTKLSNSKNADFCSLYGKTDPFEDFAECYIFYVLQPSQFEKNAKSSEVLSKKLAFIKEQVFNGAKIIESSKTFVKSQVYDNTKLTHAL